MSRTEARIPLAEEQLSVEKRQVETAKVRVRTETEFVEEQVSVDLLQDEVEVTRVPIGRAVEKPPALREEGDVLIVPVLEEVLVVEKRLVLKEELRIARRAKSTVRELPVVLRKQRAVIDRLPSSKEEDSKDE
jgi:uncharacterized protein (TIGR02271 family)